MDSLGSEVLNVDVAELFFVGFGFGLAKNCGPCKTHWLTDRPGQPGIMLDFSSN